MERIGGDANDVARQRTSHFSQPHLDAITRNRLAVGRSADGDVRRLRDSHGHDAERNPRVDLASCRRLGVRSILVSPLRHYRRTLGVFEVLSSSPGAFDARDVATMQLLSSMMVAAISRISSLHQAQVMRRAG